MSFTGLRQMNPKNVKLALSKCRRRVSTRVLRYERQKSLEEANDCHDSVFAKGREARALGVALCRGRTPPVEADPVSGHRYEILLEDPETGLMTALFRWQPGSELA